MRKPREYDAEACNLFLACIIEDAAWIPICLDWIDERSIMRRAKPLVLATRYVKRFLIFPKTLPPCGEKRTVYRWLECVTIRQEKVPRMSGPYGLEWRDMCWTDISKTDLQKLVDKNRDWEETEWRKKGIR